VIEIDRAPGQALTWSTEAPGFETIAAWVALTA
jgi:hypothetical protein